MSLSGKPLTLCSQAIKKIMRPYTIDAKEIEWWTIYISTSLVMLHLKRCF